MRIGIPRNPALVLVLSILTCGLYYLYVIYIISAETKAFLGETEINMSPAGEVLLTLVTCSIWNWYWDYRMGKRMAEMCQRVGLPVTDNAVLYLVLDILQFGFINMLVQQDTLNRIWKAARAGGSGPYGGGWGRQIGPSPSGTPSWGSSNPMAPNGGDSSETGTWYSSGNKTPRQPRPPMKK